MNKKAAILDSSLPVSDLAEGPVWDGSNNHLYWVDITGRNVHRYHTISGAHYECPTPSMVGFAIPDDGGKLIVGLQDGIYRLDFAAGDTTCLVKPSGMILGNRFNDAKADPKGRLWAGTMNLHPDTHMTGSLYRYDERGLREFESGVGISNGLGWSPDGTSMYYTDTIRDTIWVYDYDMRTGAPDNRRIFAEFKNGGHPDGLTIDAQGRILTAQWDGWGIEILTPDGKTDGKIDLPVPQVSSCTFGGPDLKTLFITTARQGLSAARLQEAPLSGCVFAVEMDVPGLPAARCRSYGPF